MQRAAARQQLRLLGGVTGSVVKSADLIESALVLIQRNVEVVTEGGLRTDKRNVASLLVEEVGKLQREDKIITSTDEFVISQVLDDDSYVVRVFLRD